MLSHSAPLRDIDANSRLHNVADIVNILIQLEKDPDQAILYNLAQSFEQHIYDNSESVSDYYNRVKKKRKKLADKVEVLHVRQREALQKNALSDTKQYFSTSVFSVTGGESKGGGMDSSVSSAQGNTVAPASNIWDAIPVEEGLMPTSSTTVLSVYNTPQTPTLRNVDQRILSRIQSMDSDHGLRMEVENLRMTYKNHMMEFIAGGKQLINVYKTLLQAGRPQSDRIVKLLKIMKVGERALYYMKCCQDGHVPSLKSVDNLKSALKVVLQTRTNINSKIQELKQRQYQVQKLKQRQYQAQKLKQQPQQPQVYTGPHPPLADSLMKTKPLIGRENQFVAHTGSSHPPPPLSERAAAEPRYQHSSNANDALLNSFSSSKKTTGGGNSVSDVNFFAKERSGYNNSNHMWDDSTNPSSQRVEPNFFDLEPIPLTEYAEDKIQGSSMSSTSHDSKWPTTMPAQELLALSSYTSTPPVYPVDWNRSADLAPEDVKSEIYVSDSQKSNMHEKKTHDYTENERGKVKRQKVRTTMDEAVPCNDSLESQKQYARSNVPDDQERDIFASPNTFEDPFDLCFASLPIEIKIRLDEPIDKPFEMEMTNKSPNRDLGLSGSGLEHTKAILKNIVNGLPVGSEMDALDTSLLPDNPQACSWWFEGVNQDRTTTNLSPSLTKEEKVANETGNENVVLKSKINQLLEALHKEQLIHDSEIELITKENMESCMFRVSYHGLFHVYIHVAHIQMDTTGVFSLFPVDLSVLSFKESQDGGVSGGKFLPGEAKWPECNKEIYRKVSTYSLGALQDLVESKMDITEAFRCFFRWMRSYKKLFSDPCTLSNKQVSFDLYSATPLPPFGRTHKGEALFPVNECSATCR